MMKDAVTAVIKGIKCDAAPCDFIDMDVTVEQYDQWLNKPCPKCGANLLTQADYDNVKMLLEIMGVANQIFPQIPDDAPVGRMSVKMNGTGDMEMEIHPPEEGEKDES